MIKKLGVFSTLLIFIFILVGCVQEGQLYYEDKDYLWSEAEEAIEDKLESENLNMDLEVEIVAE